MKPFDWKKWCDEQRNTAVKQWWDLMGADNYAECYLYYKMGALAVFAGDTTPEGWTLASPERLHAGLDMKLALRMITRMSARIPFIPDSDPLEEIKAVEEKPVRHIQNDCLGLSWDQIERMQGGRLRR